MRDNDFALAAVADQERLHGVHVRVADPSDPLAELGRLDAGRRHALAIQSGRVAPCNNIPIVNNDVHASAPKARTDDENAFPDAYAFRIQHAASAVHRPHCFPRTVKCRFSTSTDGEDDNRYRLTRPVSRKKLRPAGLARNVRSLCFYVFSQWLTPC